MYDPLYELDQNGVRQFASSPVIERHGAFDQHQRAIIKK